MDSKWWGLMQYGVGSGSRSRVAMGRFGWAVLVAWLGVSAAGADADPLSLGKDAAVAATLYGKVEGTASGTTNPATPPPPRAAAFWCFPKPAAPRPNLKPSFPRPSRAWA